MAMGLSFVKSLVSLPVLLAYVLYRLGVFEFVTIGRLLALIPGRIGRWWRAAWYRHTLAGCGERLYVDWMAAIRTSQTRVGHNVFVGTFCWIGWADIGDNVMLGGHITVLSGRRHHSVDCLDVPMAQQQGQHIQVKIGHDVWIGNGAIIMADVAPGSVVGAGAVVTRTFEPYSILAGVPARPIRRRGQPAFDQDEESIVSA
jgi:acetyltransferase-like isoleucine patch superfamily enzyme